MRDLLPYCLFYLFLSILGLLQLQEVIKAPYSKEVQVTVRQANATNMKSILKEANKKHLYHIIADLDTDLTFLLLKTVRTNNDK